MIDGVLEEAAEDDLSDENQYLVGLLAGVQSSLRSLFTVYIDEQRKWIQSIKVSAKKCGIGLPFRL